MSLRWYRRPRLVVLNPDASALDAARAIEQNAIGAVVVQANGRVVGIVTDRDLAVRVVGRGRDPQATTLAEVMTESPATLTLADGIADAIRLMQENNIRRIPLVEDARVVGIVTLDDLLLDEAAPLEALAAIVQAQLAGRPAAGNGGSTAGYRRSVARAEATLGRFLAEVHAQTGLDERAQSRVALEVVLHALVRRLTASEAKDFIAQLPSLLQPDLRALPPGPDKAITAASIAAELVLRLDVTPIRAVQVLAEVAGVIAGSVSDGEAEDVRSQLSDDLRELFRYREPVPLFI